MVGVGVTAIILLVAFIWGKRQTPLSVPCVAIEYDIQDSAKRMYLESGELNLLLESKALYPVDKPLSSMSLYKMEQAINHHPMVRHAECFLTPRNIVKVELTQRAPILRVITDEETWLVDSQRQKMEAREAVTDSVPVVKGTVNDTLACTDLADYAQWLRTDSYWWSRVGHLDVHNPQWIYLYLKDTTQPRILLGSMENYRSKFAKLRTFLEDGSDAVQGKQYTELDLRFKDQVIGR